MSGVEGAFAAGAVAGSTAGRVGGNVVPFRRRVAGEASRRPDPRGFLDAVYASGSLPVAAGDRETKLIASRLQVYGFLVVDEVAPDGSLRRLKPSQAIRAPLDRPWRVSKASFGATLDVTMPSAMPAAMSVAIPAADAFLFEAPAAS